MHRLLVCIGLLLLAGCASDRVGMDLPPVQIQDTTPTGPPVFHELP